MPELEDIGRLQHQTSLCFGHKIDKHGAVWSASNDQFAAQELSAKRRQVSRSGTVLTRLKWMNQKC